MDATAARSGARVGLCHQEKFVHGIKLHIGAAEKLLRGTGERLRKPGLRREIVELYAKINLRRGACGTRRSVSTAANTLPLSKV